MSGPISQAPNSALLGTTEVSLICARTGEQWVFYEVNNTQVHSVAAGNCACTWVEGVFSEVTIGCSEQGSSTVLSKQWKSSNSGREQTVPVNHAVWDLRDLQQTCRWKLRCCWKLWCSSQPGRLHWKKCHCHQNSKSGMTLPTMTHFQTSIGLMISQWLESGATSVISHM